MYARSRVLIPVVVLAVVSLFLISCGSVTQSVPGLNSVMGREPVTTNLKDATTEIPHLDGWNPAGAKSLASQPRDKTNNGFILTKPGPYKMEAQSYCLHAGTYAPGGGDGYLYAPLKGTRDKIIGNILKRSVNHPEVPQHNIQTLIWAIEAKAKITELSPSNAVTASKLLTPVEIAQLNDVYAEEYLGKLVSSVIPPEVQSVLDAQKKIRGMVKSAQSTYEDIEKVAVLTGAAPWGEGSRKTPAGRWSYQPDGYFVSYLPHGYSHTSVTMYAPECIRIVRDDMGRVILLEDQSGNRLDIAYSGESAEVSGDSNMIGYGFASVKFKSKATRGQTLGRNGWTFMGIPNGKGNPSGGGAFADMPTRYQWAVAWAKKHDNWVDAPGAISKVTSLFKSKSAQSGFMDLPHLEYALQKAGLKDPTDLVRRAWLYEICVKKGACPETCRPSIIFEPSESVATPGNTSRQRLGQSTRVRK